jgi:hypothetical protein
VQFGRSAHIGQVVGEGLRVLALLDSRAGDFDSADLRLAEAIAIHEAAGDRVGLFPAHAGAAEVAASRGDIARAVSHLAAGIELAPDMHASERTLMLIQSAAYIAHVDGRVADAAVLFGARLGLSPTMLPNHFRPILEALEKEGHRDEIAAGTNLSADEALERVAELASARRPAPT